MVRESMPPAPGSSQSSLPYHGSDLTFACMKQAYDCGINFFDTAEG